ncbi:hypothetical protein H072_9062 [Dactylellina haptotyla CBS 200.50]|uniref:Geranylgeranyl pyrophosphate synthetase n=1 Tax=Dactylellina haptotyla (strain CBS 200.50) TaxID=1284197 RepID=S8A835_DACHA|nr:hypothetical protein H072_9062 [Dactylellina haptotyla CBS 200.50]
MASRNARGIASREAWMWKDIKAQTALLIVEQSALEPADSSVSSSPECELLCTYNWQDAKDAVIQVPGHAPIWQEVPLPIQVPEDQGTYFVDQNAGRIPQYPFEPVFRATLSMNPLARFDDVDLVVNRNSLRKLFDFCKGVSQETFRVDLHLVRNTLFIERRERSAREMIRGSGGSGYGRNFEKLCTKFPNGVDHSTGHHRVLRYPLGNLNCVVRFEVDACYKVAGETNNSTHSPGHTNDGDALIAAMANLNMKTSISPSKSSSASKIAEQTNYGNEQPPGVMPQSTAAEIKTTARMKGRGRYIPQLWFGRTPWLIVAHHNFGIFDGIQVTNVVDAGDFAYWETRYQDALRKMVTLIEKMRETVRRNQGKYCVAIFEQFSNPRCIKVYASSREKQALPDELVDLFWLGEDGGVSLAPYI